MVTMLNLKLSLVVTQGVASIQVLDVPYRDGKALLEDLRFSIAKGSCIDGMVEIICSPDDAGRVIQKVHDHLWKVALQ